MITRWIFVFVVTIRQYSGRLRYYSRFRNPHQILIGYIDQLVDPYDIFNTTINPDTSDAIEDLCKAKGDKSDWAKAKLVDLDQRAQEDWFAKWVSELVRIVKPGKSVLIENVVMPLCDDLNDWGGVRREWWRSAVSKYKWDVDIDSISTWGKKTRYNVSMRKNARVV